MKMFLKILGMLLALCGGVWFLQGINILPGSFMTGQTKWAIIGGATLALGVVALVGSRYLGRKATPRR